jgi:hypothetical protein
VRLAADLGNTFALEFARLRAAAIAMAIVGGVFMMCTYFSYVPWIVNKIFQRK